MTHVSAQPLQTPSQRAEAEQLQASDPRVSAFVSAHAGAGKTKLLIDRLLRLMLDGADPERILCLTYTKAAAAEMAIRLQKRLGEWVTLDDAALDAKLRGLPIVPDREKRASARALFARVLDLPGGMRIGTIHAFCQSLLKRFPLEAEISPHFRLIEPADARADLETAREHALPAADPAALATLAGLVGADAFAGLVASLESDRGRLGAALALSAAALQAAMRRVLGVRAADEAGVIAGAVSWPDEEPLRQQLLIASKRGSDGVKGKALQALDWLARPASERRERWAEWVTEFLRDDGEPRGLSVFASKKLDASNPEIQIACAAEQSRLVAVHDEIRAMKVARVSAALVQLASPILKDYAQTKDRGALLDYSDLIGRTAKLLERGSAWVLFKLDGGLDHLLLDEVQDTAPEQWTIADRLTADFFTGAGARPDGLRTMFAVGDRKQSIYSFQGADPEEFDRWRAIYARRVEQAGLEWRATVLDVSFRSTAPVLALVDAVFALPEAAGGVCAPGELRHVPNRTGHAGRVDFWPLAPRPEKAVLEPWVIPATNQSQTSAPETLVAELARWIAAELASGTMLESAGRRLHAGDILILVRRRGEFDRALVRALKGAGVPVAGLDRMVLTEQAAVQDLLSLCEALLLPGDDLTFAEMLVSPLGGLSDDSLMALAAGRGGRPLFEVLRSRAGESDAWRQADAFFAALLSRVDYASPHALLTEALGALGGRARLYARLGPQAAEPIDELLAAALQFSSGHPPSLQGFVHWLRQSAAEVKREAEAAGGTVRIMTVHGAKGLEAPLVILPDTTGLPPEDGNLFWLRDVDTGADLPLWLPNKDLRCEVLNKLRAERQEARLCEYHRLLYVALTRAKDRLLVCGWQVHKEQDGSWYRLIERGLRTLAPTVSEFGAWPGEALSTVARQEVAPEAAKERQVGAVAALPAWAGTAPDWKPHALPPEPALPRPLAPSRPEGVDYGPVPPSRSPLVVRDQPDRYARGLVMHSLLQHLPDLPDGEREGAALEYAERSGVPDGAVLAERALAVLRDPTLAPLFGLGSRAEQPVAGLAGGQAIVGQVDRLAVTTDAVLIADYKTSRNPPASPDSVPVLYLRQMAAYRAVVRLLYPDRPVRCLLIWTEGPSSMVLPDRLLDRHAPGTANGTVRDAA